ncbi:M15 family metallopeptidase [Bacillus bombysepticus]|uniref:M15 family metallopeptidase n=1 Tax=Bacillus bombysepticus TaxID=658666 RepID=UPI003015EDFA
MKKWLFISLFIVCTICTEFFVLPLFQNEPNAVIGGRGSVVKDTDTQKKEITEIEIYKDEQLLNSINTDKIDIAEEEIYKGDLLLVNKNYPLKEVSVRSDIVKLNHNSELVRGYVIFDRNLSLSKDVAKKFLEVVDAAGKDGVHNFLMSSGYRDFNEQSKLYKEMGSDYALPPGYSEHNLGLSLDVGSTQMKMEIAPEGKWVEENVWKHGFILRYPKNKSDITGIQYEPWHIRYVGLPHSTIMQEKKITLEEYLEVLKEKKEISADVEGKRYTVSYYKVSKNIKVNIPVNKQYEVSGNNMDGVIVTVHE